MRSTTQILQILFVILSPMFAVEARADLYIDMLAGGSQGTLRTDQDASLLGYHGTVSGGVYFTPAERMHLALGASGRSGSLSYAVDGVRKRGLLQQAGGTASTFFFLGTSFQIELGATVWSKSDFFVASSSKAEVNGKSYQNNSFVHFFGSTGYEGKLNFLWGISGRNGRSSKMKWGFGVSGLQQMFPKREEHVVTQNDQTILTDKTIESDRVASLTLVNASIVAVGTF